MAAVRLPNSGYIVDGPEGRFVVYDFYNQGGRTTGNVVAFSLEGVDFTHNHPTFKMSQEQWNALDVTKAGSASELATFNHERWSGNTAFQDFIAEQAETLFPDIDVQQHPDLVGVLFQYIGNPDMSDAQIEEAVRKTDYWQGQTDLAREWTGLSEGEQEFRVNEQATQLVRLWQTYLGQPIDIYNGELRDFARRIASGEIGQGFVIETFLKPRALENPESPYSRQVREEEEAQRKRPVDIENRATQVRQQALRWGVEMTGAQINQWANQLTELERSDEDLLTYLQKAATQLYPWKDPELETEQAAQPWLAAHERVLGQQVSLMNADVQRALQASQSVPDYESSLRQKDEWIGTEDFKQRSTSVAEDLGRRMGFI